MKLKWYGTALGVFALGAASGVAAHRLYKFQPMSHAEIRQNTILSHARQNSYSIVVIGDSRVEQAEVGSLCGMPTLNMGYAGARISTLAGLAPAALAEIRPKLVIIAVGINDTARDQMTGSEEVRQSYRKIVTAARAVGAAVVLMDVAPVGSDNFPLARNFDRGHLPLMNDEVRRTGLPVLPLAAAMHAPGSDELSAATTPDGVHFNRRGYEIWMRVLRGACAHLPTSKQA